LGWRDRLHELLTILLKFVLAEPAVTGVIPGTGNPTHMADNCQAGTGPMTGNGSPLDGIGRFSIVSLSFRVCAKANVGLMRAAPTPAASRKKLVRDKSLVSKDFKLRRIVKRFYVPGHVVGS